MKWRISSYVRIFADALDRVLDSRLCVGMMEKGNNASGIYTIKIPKIGSTTIFCDQTTDNGGWLVRFTVAQANCCTAVDLRTVRYKIL